MSDAMRTSSGAPSQKARDSHGNNEGKYPIFDHKSAHDALQLRGHAPDPAAVIARCRAWAQAHGDKAILAECDAAAEKDKNKTESRSEDIAEEIQQVEFGGVETRSASTAIGAVDFPDRTITLLAVPYEQPTQVLFQRDIWNEVFSRTAFDGIETRFTNPRSKRIPATASLIIPNPNHDEGKLIGRVVDARSGTVDGAEGLIATVKVSDTRDGTETLHLADDNAVSPSVGFQIHGPNDQQLDRYSKTRRVNRAFLHHLSFVAEPAYTGARVLSVRSTGDLDAADAPAMPKLDEFLNDPVLQWANERTKLINP